MITPFEVKTLHLEAPANEASSSAGRTSAGSPSAGSALAGRPSAGRAPHISAASGLIAFQDLFYVVSDDESSLFEISSDPQIDARAFQLNSNLLPLESSQRKKLKADFESLTWDPIDQVALVVPSGSKPQRQKGWKVPFTNIGPCPPFQEINFAPFFESLNFDELNIEGAVFLKDEFLFLNRGNSVLSPNAIIRCRADDVRRSVYEGELKSTIGRTLQTLHLGEINHHPLAFTDACPFQNDQFLYLASAEKTDNTYDDGEFLGAVLGVMNLDGQSEKQIKLHISEKPEGICIHNHKIWIVTDADDRTKPSKLYSIELRSFVSV